MPFEGGGGGFVFRKKIEGLINSEVRGVASRGRDDGDDIVWSIVLAWTIGLVPSMGRMCRRGRGQEHNNQRVLVQIDQGSGVFRTKLWVFIGHLSYVILAIIAKNITINKRSFVFS